MCAARAQREPGRALSIDWLLGLGSGAFACGASSGAFVRNVYAHLMLAAPQGGDARLLRALDARLTLEGRTYALEASRAGADHGIPSAERVSFSADPWPRWTWRAEGAVVEKSLVPIDGHPGVIAVFRHREGPRVRLMVTPVIQGGAEEPDSESALGPPLQTIPGRVRIGLGDDTLTLWHGGAFLPLRATRATLDPDDEAISGLPRPRRAWVPGLIEASLGPGESLHVIASGEADLLRALAREDRLGSPPPRSLSACAELIESAERERMRWEDAAARAAANRTARRAAEARHPGAGEIDGEAFGEDDPWIGPLSRAVRLGWRGASGRESLVESLPRAEERGVAALRSVRALIALDDGERARDVLVRYGQLVRNGVVPSGFAPDGSPRWGGIESSLWLVVITEHVARRTDDYEFARRALYPSLEHIIDSLRTGKTAGARVGADALLETDEPGACLRRADLNALWYQAQVAIGQLARALGHKEQGAFSLASARAHQARMNEVLWDEEAGCLFHAVSEAGPIRGLEPSQLLATLSPAVLPPDRVQRLVRTVERELFTWLGLREAPGGTRVRPEWLGPFMTAMLRANGRSAVSQTWVSDGMDRLRERFGFGASVHLPTAFELVPDGAAATGEPVSVLAAAELLRMWIEELDHVPMAEGTAAAD